MMNTKKYLSFFSGGLGLDLGLEQAGFECLSINEKESKFIKTIELNKSKSVKKIYNCDISELSSEKLKKDLNIKTNELFAIVGGPPCQSFSTAGKRLGLIDSRGNSFLHFINISLELQPKYIIIENVRGLLSSPLKHTQHIYRDDSYGTKKVEFKGGTLAYILKRLESGGYTVNFNLYDMSYYGVPQKRERIIIFASRDGIKVPDIYPTHFDDDNKLGKKKVRTLRQTIKNIKSKHWINFSNKRLKFFKLLKAGENWKNLPNEKIKKEAMGNSYFSGGGKTGFFRRLSWDKPCPTLLTNPAMMSTALCHPSEDRPLSIEEYKAIQTFPKEYKIAGSILSQYKQLGNAIPCLFGKLIGEHLNKIETNTLKQWTYNLKLSRYKNTSYDEWKIIWNKNSRLKKKNTKMEKK